MVTDAMREQAYEQMMRRKEDRKMTGSEWGVQYACHYLGLAPIDFEALTGVTRLGMLQYDPGGIKIKDGLKLWEIDGRNTAFKNTRKDVKRTVLTAT